MNFLQKFKEGLSKTRQGLERQFEKIFSGSKPVGPEFLDSLEEVLISADLGVITSQQMIARLQTSLKQRGGLPDQLDLSQWKAYLKQELLRLIQESRLDQPSLDVIPRTILVVGVNGVGKTTTIGKLAVKFRTAGQKVLLAAGDTFRAAAIEQLEVWGRQTHCDVITQQPGSDPSAVAFDAVSAAKARGVDILIVDTAGRLHTKFNLMEELKKIKRVMAKALPGSPHEVLMVLDATTGQNALSQARMFHEAVGVTGIIMTKLDGTARGGILVGITGELKIPIRYVGVGEGPEDLLEFESLAFVEGLLEG